VHQRSFVQVARHLDSGLIQVCLRIRKTLDFDYNENDRFRRALAC